jgi:RimJ/RimL family protein N-acetyltransferase
VSYRARMLITLRALTFSDVEAHNAGEDEQTVRWLSGGYGTVESTTGWFAHLADNARIGRGAQGFGVCLDGRLAGYVEYNADVHDDHERGDVRISYAVHPWARGRGVAVKAVALICEHIREREIGTRAVIRVEPENEASVRVAEKAGFAYVHDFLSATHKSPDGTPATLRLYVQDC